MYTIEEVKNILTVLDKVSNDVKLVGGSFLSQADNYGNTILHQLVKTKDPLTIQLYSNVISKMDQETKSKLLNSQNQDGNTAFHIAVENNEIPIAKILDSAGADKNIKNKGGYSVVNDEQNPKVSLDQSSPRSIMSEYQMNLFTLLGGGYKKLNEVSTDISVDNAFGKIKNLNNITTEISIDNNMRGGNLNGITTEISIDNNMKGGNTNNLNNFASEVSVENAWKRPLKLKNSLNEFASEVSVEMKRSPPVKRLNQINELTTEVSVDNISEVSGGSSSSSSESSQSGSGSSSSESPVSSSSYSSSYISSSSDSNSSGMRGGGDQVLSDTSSFVKSLLTQFNSMKGGSRNGGSKTITGRRELPSLSEYEVEMYGGRDAELSREQMKESSNLHDEVVKMFMDEGKSEEEARIMKMALYKYTKEHNPELNNLDRAKKMREYADDKKIVSKLDLVTSKKIYEENKKAKSEMSTETKTETPAETTEEKPKKAKKTSVKKTSVKKSKK
jgi:hypothetical protein